MDIKNKYQIIYADPPWSYNDKRENPGKNNPNGMGAGNQYPTMSIHEICGLEVEQIAEKDSVLFMWVTMPLLQEGLDVIKAWGFKYKTCGFVWVKTTDNGKYRSGIGNYTNSNAELCLIGTKGKGLERINKDIKQIISSKITTHSAKPHEVYTRIEQLYGNVSKIELFSRHKREGWDVFGFDAPTETQKILR